MIHKIKNQNISHNAFTLVEMMIVLIIMWIMLMVTLYLSWDQIQKVKDKTVKESILAEMQSRYSKNLWSSSFWWTMYDYLDIELSKWDNKITFSYYTWDSQNPFLTNDLTDKFEIRYMANDYDFDWNTLDEADSIKLRYTPYSISCKILEWEVERNNVVLITNVNDSRNYCFEINSSFQHKWQ